MEDLESIVNEINILPKVDLSTTVRYMTHPDYRVRFIAEYMQVKIRHDSLENVLIKDELGELDFSLSCSRDMLEDQLFNMKEYMESLKKRAIVEKIPLPRI